jgi:methionyl-tRNA formyltransferase
MKYNGVKIGLFAYNFPHKKTVDFIVRMLAEQIPIDVIIAADAVKLPIHESSVKTKIRHQELIHPKLLADRLGIRYEVHPHNSEEAVNLVKEMGLDIGIIAGARILKEPVINAFRSGVINFHPGMLPEVRGLDALLWSVHFNQPLGVSAHLINRQIDAGLLLEKKKLRIYEDDTVFDLSERLYEYQLGMIRSALDKTIAGEHTPIDNTVPYNRKMPAELELEVMKKVPAYIREQCAPVAV